VFDPASGGIRELSLDELRRGRVPLGFPRAFALVLPETAVAG
jgi:hypothetical protein